MPLGLSDKVFDDLITVDAPPIGTDLERRRSAANFSGIESTAIEAPFAILNKMEDNTTNLRRALIGYTRELENNKEKVSELEGEAKTLKATIKEQEFTIRSHAKTNEKAAAEAKGQIVAMDQQKKIILELEEQVSELKQRLERSQNEKLVIDNRNFDKFPSGDANAGLYVTKQGQLVTVGDTDYTENVALSEFKNIQLGGTLTDTVTLDRIPYKRILGGKNDAKLVQDLGPHSIFEHEGKFYVRWLIRTEKPLSL